MTLAQTITRLKRLSREHRIAHLRSIIPAYPSRSIRRRELELLLRDEVTKQIRKELVHRTSQPASAVIGHPAGEFA